MVLEAEGSPMLTRPTRRAVTDWTISWLYDEIFAGRLSGGDALSETELSERLGVSRSPVREALRELERERLSAELAASRITHGELEELRRTIAVMQRVAVTGREGHEEHFDADFAFHEAICRGARTHRLEALLRPLWRQTRSLLKQIDMAEIYPRGGELDDARADHSRIVEALARGDSEAAGKAMADHLASRRDVLVAAIAKHK